MKRPIALFYILVLYVILQFSWWAYLLINLNDVAYTNKIELLEKKHQDPIVLALEKKKAEVALHKSWQMVIGEGSVFLILLLIGIYITNHAFRRESALNRQQHNFLLSITHEFKSPLAAVKLNLQTIQKRNLPHEHQQDMLNKAIMETERIEQLVEKSLMATRFDDRTYEFGHEPINLSDLVYRIVNDHIEIRNHDHNIIHHIKPSIKINGDSTALTSMLVNLVENAEKYSPPATTIEIKLLNNEKEAIILVSDQGQGVPKSERNKIFDKFYRIGNEDTRKTKGTGLGLYIAKQVAELHNGKIFLESNQPTGSVFKISIPLLKS